MASMVKRPVPDRDSSEDELQEMFHKFHITDTTASLLQEEGYTSIKLLENLGTLGPDAVNEISGLRGAQKAAVKAMLKALVPDEGDTSLRPPPYSSFEEVNLSSQPPPFAPPGNQLSYQQPPAQLPSCEVTESFPVFVEGAMLDGRRMTVTVSSNDDVRTVLHEINEMLPNPIPENQIQLNYGNKRLEIGNDMASYGVTRNSTLWLAIRAHGGKKCF